MVSNKKKNKKNDAKVGADIHEMFNLQNRHLRMQDDQSTLYKQLNLNYYREAFYDQ